MFSSDSDAFVGGTPDYTFGYWSLLTCFFIGGSSSEVGGAGTIYTEKRNHSTQQTMSRQLRVDNHGLAYPRDIATMTVPLHNLLDGNYIQPQQVGGVTWLFHQSNIYRFETLVLYPKVWDLRADSCSLPELVIGKFLCPPSMCLHGR